MLADMTTEMVEFSKRKKAQGPLLKSNSQHSVNSSPRRGPPSGSVPSDPGQLDQPKSKFPRRISTSKVAPINQNSEDAAGKSSKVVLAAVRPPPAELHRRGPVQNEE